MSSNVKRYSRHDSLSLVLFLIIAIITSLSSCTVKADRELCPSILSLNLEKLDEEVDRLHFFMKSEEGVKPDSVRIAGGNPRNVSLAVPKGKLDLMAVPGEKTYWTGAGELVIPEGTDCPPVWFFSRTYQIQTSEVKDTVELFKNYCRLSIKFHYEERFELKDWDMVLVGNICGYSIDGSPLEGDFSCRLVPDEEGRCQIDLPRQKESSLSLEMKKNGKLLQSFAVGEFMREVGYDWTTPHLKNCRMDVDVSLMAITFQIGTWKKSFSFKIII